MQEENHNLKLKLETLERLVECNLKEVGCTEILVILKEEFIYSFTFKIKYI